MEHLLATVRKWQDTIYNWRWLSKRVDAGPKKDSGDAGDGKKKKKRRRRKKKTEEDADTGKPVVTKAMLEIQKFDKLLSSTDAAPKE